MDYCGPQGKGWFARLLSWLIPDKVFGVYLGACCAQHDYDYATDDRRKNADKEFRRCIACRFRSAAIQKSNKLAKRYKIAQGWVVKWWYYIGVRLGGWMCDD